MNRHTGLAAATSSDARPGPSGPLPGPEPSFIPRRDLLVVGLAFAADLMFVGFFNAADPLTRFGRQPVPDLIVIAVVAVMASALFWRRQAALPVLVYALTLTAGIALTLEGAQPLVCVLVALYAAARRTGPRGAYAVLTLGLLTAAVNTVGAVAAIGYEDVEIYQILFVGGVLTSVVLGVWGVARREQAAADRAAALATQIDRGAELATQAERERIARELHDILAHSVSAMMMQAAGARAVAQMVTRDQPEDRRVQSIQEALASIETTGSRSMRELHRLLGTWVSPGADLEPSGSSEPPGLGDLDDLVDIGRHSGLIVEVHRSGAPGELDPSVGIAAYRTVQESLTNALKHLGRGTVVDIYESWDEQQVQVQVRCRAGHDPVRLQPQRGGLGLQGLRERVELAGGQFEAGWVGDEFVTTAVLPQSGERSGAREDET